MGRGLTDMTHTCRICGRTPEQTTFFHTSKGLPLIACVECMAKQRKADNPETAREMRRIFARKITPAIEKMKRNGDW